VLALRALGLGDLLTAVPALRGLRRGLPSHRLVLATPPELGAWAVAAGLADAAVPARGVLPPGPGPVDWVGRPPALAVNLHGRGPRSHRVLQMLRPGRLLAYACPEAEHTEGPVWRQGEHEVQRWCRLLAHAGIFADPADLDLPAPPEPSTHPGAVVVHPGAASGSKRWPPARFADVAAALRGRGLTVVVTGTTGERDRAVRVADLAGLPRSHVLAGRTSLAQLAALVASARLVVCGDTGVGHLATAYRTPSVLLFGPVSPDRWGPPPHRLQHRVLWHGSAEREVHGDRPDPALLAVTVADVLGAADAVLAAVEEPASRATTA